MMNKMILFTTRVVTHRQLRQGVAEGGRGEGETDVLDVLEEPQTRRHVPIHQAHKQGRPTEIGLR